MTCLMISTILVAFRCNSLFPEIARLCQVLSRFLKRVTDLFFLELITVPPADIRASFRVDICCVALFPLQIETTTRVDQASLAYH